MDTAYVSPGKRSWVSRLFDWRDGLRPWHAFKPKPGPRRVNQTLKDTLALLQFLGFQRWECAKAIGCSLAELEAMVSGHCAPPDEGRWRSNLTLMVQYRASELEDFLNSRGIVTNWNIFPTVFADRGRKVGSVTAEAAR